MPIFYSYVHRFAPIYPGDPTGICIQLSHVSRVRFICVVVANLLCAKNKQRNEKCILILHDGI